MIEPLIGTVIAAVAFFIGYYCRGIDKRTAAPDLTPRCQCKHIFSAHKKGYACQAIDHVKRNHFTEAIRCSCTIYVGPDPILSGLWSPPIEK